MRTFALVVMFLLAAPSAVLASSATPLAHAGMAGFAPAEAPPGYPRDLPYVPWRSMPGASLKVDRTGISVGVEYRLGAPGLRDDFLGRLKDAGWNVVSRRGEWTVIRKDALGPLGVWSFRVVTVDRHAGQGNVGHRLDLRWNRGSGAGLPPLVPFVRRRLA